MATRRVTVTVTTTGSNGSSTGSNVTPVIDGEIKAIYPAYGTQPNTTDIVITEKGQSPALTVFSLANANTSGWFFPLWPAHKASDGSAFTDIGSPICVGDQLNISVTGADNNKTLDVTIVWDDRK